MSAEETKLILRIILSTFLFVTLFIPFIKKIALHINAIDYPNKRKVHTKATPRLGGVGIYFGFLLGYMLFGEPSAIMNAILIGSFVIVLTGVIDDIKPLKPSTKFMGQVIAASIVVFYGNILLKNIQVFGLYIDFGIFTYPLTIFFILGCINCMNFIDGLDGLAAGISSIYFLTIGIIAIIQHKLGLDFILTFTMFGSTLGFLVYNFYPASIFMGDSGSMFLGFVISIIALLGFKNVTMTSLIIPLLILAIPILDVLFAILRRFFNGQKISAPDKYHIHHQLLNRNLSQRTVVLIIYVINLLFATASIIYILRSVTLGYIIYGLLLIIILFFILRTSVIFSYDNNNHKKRKKRNQKSKREV